MIEQQVRAWDVLDERILDSAAGRCRASASCRKRWRELAFADSEIPSRAASACCGRCWSGRILQALSVQPGEQVLEIGTGSGYVSACLAQLGGRVRTLELHEETRARWRARI